MAKKEGMKRRVEDDEPAVAGADEGFFDLFLGITLKDELVVFKAKPDGFFEQDLEQRRDQHLLEMLVHPVAVNIDAKHRAFDKRTEVYIFRDGFVEVFAVGDHIHLIEDGFGIVLAQDLQELIVM